MAPPKCFGGRKDASSGWEHLIEPSVDTWGIKSKETSNKWIDTHVIEAR